MIAVRYQPSSFSRLIGLGCSLLLLAISSSAVRGQDSGTHSIVSLKLSLSGTFPGGAVVLPPRENSGDDGGVPVSYPADAEKEGVEGTVRLKMLIGADGEIKKSDTLDNGGDERLLRASVEGLRSAGFAPGSLDDKPTQMWVTVEVKFSSDPAGAGEESFGGSGTTAMEPELQATGAGEISVDESKPAPVRSYDMDAVITDVKEPTYKVKELGSLLEYPKSARKHHLDGKVVISVQVSPTGEPLQTLVRSASDSVFIAPVMKAVPQLHFTPGTQNGEPVQMWKTFAISFKLEE